MNSYTEQPLHAAHPRLPAHLRERNLIEIVLNLVLSLGSNYMLYSALFGCPHMEILALMIAVFDGMIVFPIFLAMGIAALCFSAISTAFIGKRLGVDGKMYLAEANAGLMGCVSLLGLGSAGMGVSAMIVSYTAEAFVATTWITIVTTALTAGYTYECVIWALNARSLSQARGGLLVIPDDDEDEASKITVTV